MQSQNKAVMKNKNLKTGVDNTCIIAVFTLSASVLYKIVYFVLNT